MPRDNSLTRTLSAMTNDVIARDHFDDKSDWNMETWPTHTYNTWKGRKTVYPCSAMTFIPPNTCSKVLVRQYLERKDIRRG